MSITRLAIGSGISVGVGIIVCIYRTTCNSSNSRNKIQNQSKCKKKKNHKLIKQFKYVFKWRSPIPFVELSPLQNMWRLTMPVRNIRSAPNLQQLVSVFSSIETNLEVFLASITTYEKKIVESLAKKYQQLTQKELRLHINNTLVNALEEWKQSIYTRHRCTTSQIAMGLEKYGKDPTLKSLMDKIENELRIFKYKQINRQFCLEIFTNLSYSFLKCIDDIGKQFTEWNDGKLLPSQCQQFVKELKHAEKMTQKLIIKDYDIESNQLTNLLQNYEFDVDFVNVVIQVREIQESKFKDLDLSQQARLHLTHA